MANGARYSMAQRRAHTSSERGGVLKQSYGWQRTKSHTLVLPETDLMDSGDYPYGSSRFKTSEILAARVGAGAGNRSNANGGS